MLSSLAFGLLGAFFGYALARFREIRAQKKALALQGFTAGFHLEEGFFGSPTLCRLREAVLENGGIVVEVPEGWVPSSDGTPSIFIVGEAGICKDEDEEDEMEDGRYCEGEKKGGATPDESGVDRYVFFEIYSNGVLVGNFSEEGPHLEIILMKAYLYLRSALLRRERIETQVEMLNPGEGRIPLVRPALPPRRVED